MAMGCMKEMVVGKPLGYYSNITRLCFSLCRPTAARNSPHNSMNMMKKEEELLFTFDEREKGSSISSIESESESENEDGHMFYWAPLPSRRAVFSPISTTGAGGPPPSSRHFNSHFPARFK